ncbi:unnamed protein product [Triticum turgidum subsp. durum]|uniref:Transcription elongation factor Eaf N-terminal domain-containing protein n=1 Tax=Triticum turgidum subsp. durum TaxID=4567 RepID=A0A9R0QWC1_TRITD|nr:unnamed protein product [Triticum turgidum subsp. durum]
MTRIFTRNQSVRPIWSHHCIPHLHGISRFKEPTHSIPPPQPSTSTRHTLILFLFGLPTGSTQQVKDEFKPASIDKTQAGSLQKSKDNRVTVEFHNNQPGRPKVAFEGSQEEYKDNDGVLFFDGETFRLERLHRAVKRLRHVRVPGESTSLAATTTGMGESHSPPLAKVGKLPATNKPSIHPVPTWEEEDMRQ